MELQPKMACCLLCALFAHGAALPMPKWYSTEYLDAKLDHNGRRSYHVIVPDGYPSRAPYPAIILFHGNGADAASMYYETNMTQIARSAGYVLVFAEGVATANSTLRSKERSWNAGTCCDYAFLNQIDDVAYGAAVISNLPKKFAIDEKQIFLAGVSNGASMSFRITCELAEKVAGLAAIVGSLEIRDGRSCGSDCHGPNQYSDYKNCSWGQEKAGCSDATWEESLPHIYECSAIKDAQVPVLMFNGNLDPSSNISGQVFIPTTPAGYYETYSPISYVYNHFRHAYGCTDENKLMTFFNGTSGNHTECYSWTGCTNVTYCLADAGHRWYGDIYNVTEVCIWEGYNISDCTFDVDTADYGPQTHSISTTKQIVNFFDGLRTQPSVLLV